ncbi:hypothetical protein AB0E85_18580 [Streptomyces sp. NPDC029044]|uniref:hypothetical protein n=1 Tax=Streptomyces sp. NPDC029044 TaxID=3157198 RepID=UPI0033E31C51
MHEAIGARAREGLRHDRVKGRPVAVTGGHDNTVRMWDPTTGQQTGPRLVFPEPVVALATGGRLVVGFGLEVAALSPLT